MNALLQVFLYKREVRILVIFLFILSASLPIIYFNLDDPFVKDISEIQKQLITVSGIFTALMFGILMPVFSERLGKRRELIISYRNDCKKLAAFRAFLYYTKHFSMFRSSASLQYKYLRGRSYKDYNESYQIDTELSDLVEKGEVRGDDIGKMEFYGAIRDFTYEFPGGISFFSKYSEYTFSYEKLEYLNYCCGKIWYLLDSYDYIREAFNTSYGTHSSYSISKMNALVPIFTTGKQKTPLKDAAKFVRSQASEYEQITSLMLEKLYKILFELSPKNFYFLSIDTIFIIIFGIIIPLYTLLFRTPSHLSAILGLMCFSVTVTFIINFLLDVQEIFNKDIFRENNEWEENPLYPQEPYN